MQKPPVPFGSGGDWCSGRGGGAQRATGLPLRAFFNHSRGVIQLLVDLPGTEPGPFRGAPARDFVPRAAVGQSAVPFEVTPKHPLFLLCCKGASKEK